MSVRALSSIVRLVVTVCAVIVITPVANAGGYRFNNTQATGSSAVSYKIEVYVVVNMQPMQTYQEDYHYVGQSGPPMYLYQWNVNFLYEPGSEIQGIYGRVYYRDGGGPWTFYQQIMPVWEEGP